MALPWVLREFQLAPVKAGGRTTSRFDPAPVGDTPEGARFDQAGLTSAFRQAFLDHLPLLLRPGINDFCYGISERSGCSGFPPALAGPESTAEPKGDSDYLHHFGSTDGSFLDQIERRLTPPVTFPGQLVARAQALSCAGCHELSQGDDLGGFHWPGKSLPFVHVTERKTVESGIERRYAVSEVVEMLLEHRRGVLQRLLDQR
jgi:hypothetical protein